VIPTSQLGSFNDGWAIGVAAGRRFKQAYRAELEFAFRRNSAAVWNVDGVVEDWDGDLDTYFGMTNLYHDCINWTWRGMTPYVGAGLGFAIFDGDLDTALARFKIDEAAFAYQGITGVTKRFHRAVDGFVEYRFVGTTDVSLTRTTPNPEQGFGDFHGEFHNVLFGIRIWH
jgi:opacity protein-like surface antigen